MQPPSVQISIDNTSMYSIPRYLNGVNGVKQPPREPWIPARLPSLVKYIGESSTGLYLSSVPSPPYSASQGPPDGA